MFFEGSFEKTLEIQGVGALGWDRTSNPPSESMNTPRHWSFLNGQNQLKASIYAGCSAIMPSTKKPIKDKKC